jgi:hypothetical protein
MISDYLECIEVEGTRQIKQYEPLKVKVKIAIHEGWEQTAIEVKHAINRILYSIDMDADLDDDIGF